jgi:L-histidine Nalpha-methyltransferase
MIARVLENEFARDVRAGLSRSAQKTLPCRFLYDAVGSALFEAITWLPEYGLARADARILKAHAGEIVERLPQPLLVAELGSGTGVKTRAILERLQPGGPVLYCPIDVSATALARCVQDLSQLGEVQPVEAGYIDGLARVAALRTPEQSLLVLFLGSTIGNFESDAATDFLYSVRLTLQPGDALLLGTDLVKPIDQLLAAYDDPVGVTAAFNLNLLARINRELGGSFDLRRFAHLARYNKEAQRVEMHLASRVRQSVSIREAQLTADFEAGETIWTESCHKFRPEQVRAMARASGFRLDAQWVDREWPFAESLLIAE